MFIALGLLRHYPRRQFRNAVDAPGPSSTSQNKKLLPSSGYIPALASKRTGDKGLTAQARLSNWTADQNAFRFCSYLSMD